MAQGLDGLLNSQRLLEAVDCIIVADTSPEKRLDSLMDAYRLLGEEINLITQPMVVDADTSLKGDVHGFVTQSEDEVPSGVHGHEDSGS